MCRQMRCRTIVGGGLLQASADGFGLCFADRQDHDLAGIENIGNAHGYGVGRDIREVDQRGAVCVKRFFRKRHHAYTAGGRGSGLVEADMAVGSNPEQLAIDRSGADKSGISCSLGVLVRCGTVDEIDPCGIELRWRKELAIHVGRKRVGMRSGKTAIFIEIDRFGIAERDPARPIGLHKLGIDPAWRLSCRKPEAAGRLFMDEGEQSVSDDLARLFGRRRYGDV